MTARSLNELHTPNTGIEKGEREKRPIMSVALAGMAPFRIEPRFMARVWGFRDLRPWYDRVAEGEPIGRGLAYRRRLPCRHRNARRQAARRAFQRKPRRAAWRPAPSPDSPLLIKIIFAKEKLSVQVHPDDKLAQKYGAAARQDRVLVRAGGRAGRKGCGGPQARHDARPGRGRNSRRERWRRA